MSLATFLRCATLAGKCAQSERDIQNRSVGVLLKSKCQVRITPTDVTVFVSLESLAEEKNRD